MKIFENGKFIESVTTRNDLHNTYSVKNHKPHFVPSYKNLYLNQLRTNKGLLAVLGITIVSAFVMVLGTNLARKAELEALRSEISKRDGYIQVANQSYNEAVSILLNKGERTPEQIINTIFGKDAPLMTKIAYCESHLNPKAANKNSSARGLFQIMSSVHQVKETWLYDPTINTLIAKKLFDASGTSPWASSQKCWSK